MEVAWISIAYLCGLVMRQLRLPTLVGYLMAGFALSAYGVQGGDVLAGIAHAGVLLLLFSVGLKLRLKSLVRPEVLGGGLLLRRRRPAATVRSDYTVRRKRLALCHNVSRLYADEGRVGCN